MLYAPGAHLFGDRWTRHQSVKTRGQLLSDVSFGTIRLIDR